MKDLDKQKKNETKLKLKDRWQEIFTCSQTNWLIIVSCREHFVDSTRAISEGTGEKDTKKALEFRRKEVSVSWNRCYDFVFWWFMNLSLSKETLQELKTFEGP